MTVKDLIIAIKIIRKFLDIYRDAQYTAKQLAEIYEWGYGGYWKSPEERFIDRFLKQQQQPFSYQSNENVVQEELTDEEKERLKRLKEKMSSEGR